MRLLLTGAAGFIGTHCTTYFATQGHDVTATDLQSRPGVVPLDITDESAVQSAVEKARPEVILHLGALASVPECEADAAACWRNNLLGTVHVARAAAARGARLVFFSTAAVYGRPAQLPTPVTAPLAPTNLYGISKAAGELAVRGSGTDHVILRLFNIYGEGCSRSYVIPDLVHKLRDNPGVIPMHGTGTESRDFLYISDLLRIIETAMGAPSGAIYNAGSGTTITIRDMATKLAVLAGRAETEFQFAGPRLGDFPINFADISGANVPAGWAPRISLDEGLRRMIREQESEPETVSTAVPVGAETRASDFSSSQWTGRVHPRGGVS